MSIQDNNTKKTDLINDITNPIDEVLHPVDKLAIEIRINSLTQPKSDESAAVSPKMINTNHLFVVDGQECISVKNTIPPKKLRNQNQIDIPNIK
jgi:hypothetical protein